MPVHGRPFSGSKYTVKSGRGLPACVAWPCTGVSRGTSERPQPAKAPETIATTSRGHANFTEHHVDRDSAAVDRVSSVSPEMIVEVGIALRHGMVTMAA